MSDVDTLIVTFQTQLSDVMEAVVKTAMYEVTRLVEDGFLDELKRRDQVVESLRIQLQWAERKLSDQGGKDGRKTGKCVDCAEDDVELSCDTVDQSLQEQQDDIARDHDVKEEGDSVERWTRSGQDVVPETADSPTATHSPESQMTEDEDVLPAVEIKEEVNKLSCSVHLGVWSGSLDDEARPESHSTTEMNEEQPKQTQEDTEELIRSVIKQDPQLSPEYVFPGEQEDSHMATDPPSGGDSRWPGLPVKTAGTPQNHRLVTEKDCDPGKTRGSRQQTEQELPGPVTADGNALVTPSRDQISSSVSPKARLQNNEALGVTIKQEVIVDSDLCVESKSKEDRITKPGMASVSHAVKHHRVSTEALRQNRTSHKSTVQEFVKLHSKVATGVRLQTAIQHLHRPMKKPPHALSNSTAAALSVAHSQVANVNHLNRIPSTSKAAPFPHISVQRVHLGDKQATAHTHNRTGGSWVSIKTQLQSANSHHTNPLPHPDSHPHAGPRHLLRCGQCGKCFPHPSNLKAHLQTHTGERPFCCSLCGRSFTKLSNLKAHRRVHTGERPYCCLACGKRFTQKCNLKRHQRIHLDV